MKARSVVRRTRPETGADGAALSRAFLLGLLDEHPGVDEIAVTRRLRDGAVIGIVVGRTHAGLCPLHPDTGELRRWIDDVDGTPLDAGRFPSSSRVRRAEIVTRGELLSQLDALPALPAEACCGDFDDEPEVGSAERAWPGGRDAQR